MRSVRYILQQDPGPPSTAELRLAGFLLAEHQLVECQQSGLASIHCNCRGWIASRLTTCTLGFPRMERNRDDASAISIHFLPFCPAHGVVERRTGSCDGARDGGDSSGSAGSTTHTHTQSTEPHCGRSGPATVSVTKHYPDCFFCNEATKEKS